VHNPTEPSPNIPFPGRLWWHNYHSGKVSRKAAFYPPHSLNRNRPNSYVHRTQSHRKTANLECEHRNWQPIPLFLVLLHLPISRCAVASPQKWDVTHSASRRRSDIPVHSILVECSILTYVSRSSRPDPCRYSNALACDLKTLSRMPIPPSFSLDQPKYDSAPQPALYIWNTRRGLPGG